MTARSRPGPTPHPRALGLAAERSRRGTGQAEEARAAGVSRVTWARWEAGTFAPAPEQLAAVAGRWGVSVQALLRAPGAKRAEAIAVAVAGRRAAARVAKLATELGPDAVRTALADL